MTELIEPNIHPILVHFAYALAITSMISYWLSGLGNSEDRKASLRAAADWMLAFASLAIIATIAAGFQAYYTVAHDGPSHAAMTTHRNWAVLSGTAILLIALWRWLKRTKRVNVLFKSLLTLAAISLSVTAWWGGHIVYNYGLGVKSLPTATGDGHDHDHGKAGSTSGGHDHSDGHHDGADDTDLQAGNSSEVTPSQTMVPEGHDNSDGHHDHEMDSDDDKAIKAIISAILKGWEDGDGTPFWDHFLDFEGARYFESGGQNSGLSDLVENHVEPEKDAIPDLTLGLSDLAIYYEGDFAWAVASTTVQGTLVKSGTVLDRTGKQTWLFRKIDGEWKVVHTHSSSRAKRK